MLDPSPPVPLDDPDARLGGHDDPVLLEQLHAEAEHVPPSKRTRYEVQVQLEAELEEDPRTSWLPIGVAYGSNARDAIRQVAGDEHTMCVAGDVLRAIPVRNITQMRLDVETKTKLRLS